MTWEEGCWRPRYVFSLPDTANQGRYKSRLKWNLGTNVYVQTSAAGTNLRHNQAWELKLSKHLCSKADLFPPAQRHLIRQVDIYSPQILISLYSQTIIPTKPQLLFNLKQVLHGWQQPLKSNMLFKEGESFCSDLPRQHLSFPCTQD